MSVSDSAQKVSDTALNIAKAADASPIANDVLHDLLTVTSHAAQIAVASSSGNPVAITTASINVFTDLVKLGPEVLDAWQNFMGLFHKKTTATS